MEPNRGGWPGFRKRAFHRALRRGDPKALIHRSTRDMMINISRTMFFDESCPPNTLYFESLTSILRDKK